MATRIHVLAALGATEAEFRAALDSLGGDSSCRFRVGSSDRWMWANASVWHVDGAEIDRALDSLTVPALRVTSSDAVLWMLALVAPGKERFRGVHWFTDVGKPLPDIQEANESSDAEFPDDEIREIAGIDRFIPELAFLWDAEEEASFRQELAAERAATVPRLEDYADYGVKLPDGVIEAIKQRPHHAWHIAFQAHAVQMVDALIDFGFSLDRDATLKFLTVGPLTVMEQDSDLGNLPRFLKLLGIDGVFAEETCETEAQKPNAAEAVEESPMPALEQAASGKLFAAFDPLLAECPLADIAAGPIPIRQPLMLHLLTHLLAEDPPTFVEVEYPAAETSSKPNWKELTEPEVRQVGNRWQACFETGHWWFGIDDRETLERNDLTQALGIPPNGTRFEFACLVKGLSERCHRYAGVYRNRQWELSQSFPPVTAEILNEALELVERIFDSKAIVLASDAETEQVRRDYKRAQSETPRIRQGKIKPEYGTRDGVIQTILLERLAQRGPWDLAGARASIEAGWDLYNEVCRPSDSNDDPNAEGEASEDEDEVPSEELASFNKMMQQMSEAVEQTKQARMVPHRDEVLYEGRTGKYYAASLANLPHVSPQQLAEHDAALSAMGFQQIGDSVADVDQRQEITRRYAGHPQAISLHSHRNENNLLGWAPDNHGMFSVDLTGGTSEFHTRFTDGTTLVTTSIEAATSKPEIGLYVRFYEDVPVTRLWEKHRDGIERFRVHRQTTPIDHAPLVDRLKFYAFMEELWCRFLGID